MSRCVIDASMAAAWYLPGENPAARDWMVEAAKVGAVVPAIFPFEISNVLLTAVRRGRTDQANVAQSFQSLRRLPIGVELPHDFDRVVEVHRLAQTHGLTVYDASYLELAMRLDARLGSYDEPLLRAAKAVGVQTELQA